MMKRKNLRFALLSNVAHCLIIYIKMEIFNKKNGIYASCIFRLVLNCFLTIIVKITIVLIGKSSQKVVIDIV